MAKREKGSKKSKAAVSVDLSGVEIGSKKVIPEGKYLVSVVNTSLESSQSGNDYIKFEFEVVNGANKGYKLFHNCSLQPQALFSLKSVLMALGFEIPKKAFDLDLKELIGLECSIEVSHELYEGKKKARVTEFIGEGDDSDDEDESEIEENLSELEIDELKNLAKELGIKAKDIKKAKTEEDLIELIMEEDEDEVKEAYSELFSDEDEEDEDDSDEDDDDDEDEDYEDMSIDELKEECKDRGIKFTKKAKKKDLIELLEEDDEE